MKSQKNKTLFSIGLILTLMTAAALMTLNVNAQQNSSTLTAATHAFISVMPNPTGVGQSMYISMWLIEVNPLAYSDMPLNQKKIVGDIPIWEYRWQNYTVLVTSPDGTTTTLGPYQATDMSMVNIEYTPTQVGTYTFKFNFPGQLIQGKYSAASYYNTYYEPSTATDTLTVQQEPITAMLQTQLPTDYWQRPINWQNQMWYTISGNWFGTTQWNAPSSYNPDAQPPRTAHIVWVKSDTGPLAFGGQIGGSLYSANDLSNYYTGKSYEVAFAPPIIMNGVLFYNKPTGVLPKYGTYAVDLRTGRELWYSNNTNQPPSMTSSGGAGTVPGPTTGLPGIAYGEIYTNHNPNENGGLAYLWGVSGTTYSLYDATTGNWILNVAGSTGGTAVTGPNGELLVYTMRAVNSTTGFLSMWNATLCLGATFWPTNGWGWRPPAGYTLPWSLGVQWNATIPLYSMRNVNANVTQMPAINAVNNGVILASTGSIFYPQDYQMEAGYNATTGAYMWHTNRSVAQEPDQTGWGLMGPVSNGVYTEFNKATLQYYGFSITTGQQLWGPSSTLTNGDDSFSSGGTATDKIFIGRGYIGLNAFNLADGTSAWSWNPPSAGLQTAAPYYPTIGTNPIVVGSGDNQMVFMGTGNTHGDQLFRGAELYGIDANNGKQVWGVDGFFIGGLASADGYLVGFNGYDNQIYCFGKGQSATTVTATPGVGNVVTLQGSVTDQSQGNTCLGIPAAGTPAISDDDMNDWMNYLYMQQPKPDNAAGVTVKLSAVAPDGSVKDIGTTTSDATGSYAVSWTPPSAGLYTIAASFEGTNSYYSSSAETHISVGSTSAATPTGTTITNTSTNAVSADMFYAVSGIILVMIVAVAVLVLRKK